MGYENRTPTAAEMGKMKELIAQAMREGAFGLSAGLVYVPNSFDTTAQMIELAKVAASYGGIYSVHMRAGEGNAGLLETIQIAKGAHIPTEIFHVGMTVAHDPNFARINRSGARPRHRYHRQRLSIHRGLDLCAPAHPGLGAGRGCKRDHRAAQAA